MVTNLCSDPLKFNLTRELNERNGKFFGEETLKQMIPYLVTLFLLGFFFIYLF